MKTQLVILPGWGGSHETWANFVELAQPNFEKIMVIDLPCFGNEPCPTEVWGVEEYAEFVVGKLKSRGKVNLLGHSFGGQVAVYLAAKYPQYIEKLILTGSAVFRRRKPIKNFFFGALAHIGKIILSLPLLSRFERLAKKVLYKAAHSPDYQNTSGIQREIFKKITRQDMSDLAATISLPTQLIWGENDDCVPMSDGKKLEKIIPKSTLSVIKNGKHGLHIQKPEELLRILCNFLP